MSRAFQFRALIVSAILLAANRSMAMSAAGPLLRLGVAMDVARVSVDSSVPAELDKTGGQVGFGAHAAMDSRWWSLTLGVSHCTSQLKGSDEVRGVGQELAVSSSALQSGFFFNFSRRIGIGFKSRIQRGTAADFGIHASEQMQTMREAGGALRAFLSRSGGYDLVAEAAWLRSRGIEKRDVQTVVAGLTAALPVRLRSPWRESSPEYHAGARPLLQDQLPAKVDVPQPEAPAGEVKALASQGWDMNGDGYPDLVKVGSSESIQRTLPGRISAYDFDADGKPDFFRDSDTPANP